MSAKRAIIGLPTKAELKRAALLSLVVTIACPKERSILVRLRG